MAAQDIADRLKGVTDPKEQYALIEKHTDYQRFFPNDEGYLFTYKTDGTRINVPTNKSGNGKNFGSSGFSVGNPCQELAG